MFLIQRTNDAKDLPLPSRQTELASGLDLYANIKENITIKNQERVLIPTGVKIALSFGYEAQVRPRSGLAVKHGVTLINGIGTVDADYRGEIHALLINLGKEDFVISRGDRIAQLVITKVAMISLSEVDQLPETTRGESGFGSTG